MSPDLYINLNKTRRKVDKIIIHCSATVEGEDIDAATIDKWHKRKGWSGIGYHFFIKLDGTVEFGRPINKMGAHCRGFNKGSIGICYAGGLDASKKAKDTRTPQQKVSLLELLDSLTTAFKGASIKGHRDYSPDLNGNGIIERHEFIKMCPCFDCKEYETIT